MSACKMIPINIIASIIISLTISAYAEDEIEDLIDIAESDGKIIAVIEGRKTITYNLKPNEMLLWSGSRGHLGVFLTDRHFFVASTKSNSWHILPLRIDETANYVPAISPFLVLLVTNDRAIAFDAMANKFIETKLPLKSEVYAVKIEKHVAVVVTSSRAFGLAVRSSGFNEIKFKINESIEAVNISASKVTITTSNRLLSFQAKRKTWNEHRLN
jgi:hypothetical protein